MKIKDLYEVFQSGPDYAWDKATTTRDFQKALTKRLAGKARIAYATIDNIHQDDAGWWCILAGPNKFLPKIQRSVIDLSQQYNYDVNFTTEDTFVSDTPHGTKLLAQMKYYVGYEQLKAKQPNTGLLIAFIMPFQEQEKNSKTSTYYHVTKNKSVLETGLIPGSTLKFQNRLYLWTTLHDAEIFAAGSHHGKGPSYILQINYDGPVYVDHENKTDPISKIMKGEAVYIKETIPPNNIKLIKTVSR